MRWSVLGAQDNLGLRRVEKNHINSPSLLVRRTAFWGEEGAGGQSRQECIILREGCVQYGFPPATMS